MQQLMWFRQDLRTEDNHALAKATAQGPVVGVFIISPKQWLTHHEAPCKLDFWLRNLLALQQQLALRNIPLVTLTCDDWQTVPQALLQLAKQCKVSQLHFNQQFGVNENQRDAQVHSTFQQAGIVCHSYQDFTLLAPGSIHNQSQQPYKVFTAFKKACAKRLEYQAQPYYSLAPIQPKLAIASSNIAQAFQHAGIPVAAAHFSQLWPAGETEATQRLEDFLASAVLAYQQQRDFPALSGTSSLSPYLAAGVISIRRCFNAALQLNQGELLSGQPGLSTWLNELLWREFYLHLMAAYPKLSKQQPFQAQTQQVQWRHAPADFAAWCQGQTGMPIVDAAMRQLLATGWMHNRLRMISASFLSKNLLIDWRLGEAWFMQHLIDGELAANNGGWQWCASTGTDAAPYFRVFNPVTQAERFDPEARFIQHWLPELAGLSSKACYLPKQEPQQLAALNYPKLIVELKMSRLRAIEAFQDLKTKTTL